MSCSPIARGRVRSHIHPAALLLLAVAGVTACSDSSAPPSDESAELQVGVFTLRNQAVEVTTDLPGRTTPYRVAQVRPQVGGVIQQRRFEEGARVEAGELLYQLDDKVYRAQVEQAKAELDKAQATVQSVEANTRRIREVVGSGAVSQQEFDDARARLAEAKADVELARARLETARIDLEYTRIAASIDGRIGRSFVTEGALVTANQSAELAQITQLDPIYVDIPRSSAEVLALRQALAEGRLQQAESGRTQVRLMLEDGSEYSHSGELQFSDVTVDRDTGSVTLRAIFPNPDHQLLPGMYVQARVTEGVQTQALLVPQQGVTRDRQGQATALRVNADGSVEKRVLQADKAIGQFWLVSEGLSAGDQVIVNQLQRVSPGDQVTTEDAGIQPYAAAGEQGARLSAATEASNG
ncbi:MAG: efflux RND transporter periplasmic adaptor subunit [Oceanococcus sp.]|nr:MAG: efflux RND transporter periplasmic adaptor subunit [Oceanococcus sp.]